MASKDSGMQVGGREEPKGRCEMLLVQLGLVANGCVPSSSRDSLVKGNSDNGLDYCDHYSVDLSRSRLNIRF